jgi:hypothetical protein
VTVTSGLAADGGGCGDGTGAGEVGAGVVGAGEGTGAGVGVRVGDGGLTGAAGAGEDDDAAGAGRGDLGDRVVTVALPRWVELPGVPDGTLTVADPSEGTAAQATRPHEDKVDLASTWGVPPLDSCTMKPALAPPRARTAAAVPAAYRPGPLIQELKPSRDSRSS